jgi:hypothetical protein
MNFSYQDLVSIEEILADVLLNVNDEECKLLNIGFYKRTAKKALERLNFETFFYKRYVDEVIPTTLEMDMPSGSWNIEDIFVFNGSDPCHVGTSARVFYKQRYISSGKDMGYTARNKYGQEDSFIFPYQNDNISLYYNVINGKIMFSDYCRNYAYVRIVFNGTPTDIDKTKIIPPFAREAVVGYVTERALFSLKMKMPNYRAHWSDAKTDLYSPSSRTGMAKWDSAVYNLKRMDKKQRDDFAEYLGRINS